MCNFTPQKIRLNPVTHAVRASQAVLQYGVGAMVDFPSQTLMTAAPEQWDAQNIRRIYDARLQNLLNVDYFGCPIENPRGNGIGYVQFPRWYFCPSCRLFAPWEIWFKKYQTSPRAKADPLEAFVKQPVCPFCPGRPAPPLVVSRIVVVCRHGHIDDFPWRAWCHRKHEDCGGAFLELKSMGASEGLESIQVRCPTCNAQANLTGAFGDHMPKEVKCTGRHPWKLQHAEPCGERLVALQRGASSVYFPATFSSLVIPQLGARLDEQIRATNRYNDLLSRLSAYDVPEIDDATRALLYAKTISQSAEQIAQDIGGVRADDVIGRLNEMLHPKGQGGQTVVSDKDEAFRLEEYNTLSGAIQVQDANMVSDFRREATRVSDYDLPGIKQVVLIPKIREVQAFVGFSRLSPVAGFAEEPDDVKGASTLVCVKERDARWYPGYEARGEGIFVEFDNEWFNQWIETNSAFVNTRIDRLQANYQDSFAARSRPGFVVSAKYLFLHSLSHLLMKQLSFDCGYSIASLKERLYCGTAADGMFGLFIYTATGDSEGTLGGLVRQGKFDRFPRIFIKAIQSAMSCSNDPVCNLSQGQGRDALNLAACHACMLVPETSCENYNTILDRGLLVGTFEEPDAGIFSRELASQRWHGSGSGTDQSHGISEPARRPPQADPGIAWRDYRYVEGEAEPSTGVLCKLEGDENPVPYIPKIVDLKRIRFIEPD